MKRLNELNQKSGDIERLWTKPDVDHHGQKRGKLVSLTTDHEIDRLKASLDELNTSLDQANRRINRLLGEKTQLKSLLDKRDEQIQALNRELGRYAFARKDDEPRNATTSRLRGLSLDAMALIMAQIKGLLSRKDEAADTVKATNAHIRSGNGSRPALISRDKGDARPLIAIVLLGLDSEEIERLLPIVERDCGARAMAPLCLVDIDSFELFRKRGLIFEYLPPAEDRDRFDASLHWDLYIQRRLAVVRRKWDPVRIVAFGPLATRTLTLWSSSPFEDVPLPVGLEGDQAT